ncbi:uncharacterized protein [Pocillopora verrucosa]|uniref:uncharacterized protein isoform X2 n=1 Tax=Pocillopora verrucosa TaxID=203993 RepID=UPI00333E1EF4
MEWQENIFELHYEILLSSYEPGVITPFLQFRLSLSFVQGYAGVHLVTIQFQILQVYMWGPYVGITEMSLEIHYSPNRGIVQDQEWPSYIRQITTD